MSRRRPALSDTPADQPPPCWKRSLARHASAPSSAFGSRKYVVQEKPTIPLVRGPPRTDGEQRSVKELLKSIPTLTVPPPPGNHNDIGIFKEWDTSTVAKGGSSAQERAKDQHELASRIQHAQNEAASALEQQLKSLTEQQQRTFYHELQAARHMEHAQAQAQLNVFRHRDALVVQACINKAETEKHEAMRQLEAVVEHERTKITSMESEIKLLRDALKKAELMTAKVEVESKEQAAKGQQVELETIAELVKHHHRNLSSELETMAQTDSGGNISKAEKGMDGSLEQNVAPITASLAGGSELLPVHLQCTASPSGFMSSDQWVNNSQVGNANLASAPTETRATAISAGQGKQEHPLAVLKSNPFGEACISSGGITQSYATVPKGGDHLPDWKPTAGVLSSMAVHELSEATLVSNPFSVSQKSTPFQSQGGAEHLCSQVTTPEHSEPNAGGPSPNQTVATMQSGGLRAPDISRQFSDNPFWSQNVPGQSTPIKPVSDTALSDDTVASIFAVPNPFLGDNVPPLATGGVKSNQPEVINDDFASLFADLAVDRTEQQEETRISEGKIAFIGGASWMNHNKTTVDCMLTEPVAEAEGLDLSLAGCNGSEDSTSSGIQSHSASAVMDQAPAVTPSQKSNAMFEDDFTKLFEERHLKKSGSKVVEVKVNCTQGDLGILNQQSDEPSKAGAYIPVGMPMKSLRKVHLDGLQQVGGLFG